ncbi:MAG TPA: hypothetical protein VHB70_13370 [Parafilimonas sp.]|nr:hypothetical protein [Parafilimonas sp.]
MRFKQPLLVAAFLIFSFSLFAQNNQHLRNINKAELQQLLKEHKNIHFVFTHDPHNPVQFYEAPQQESIPQKLIQDNSIVSSQSNFHLVKDLNTQTDANPINTDISSFFYNIPYVIFNGAMYFSAFDGIHGIQIWRSDGTSSGTYRVTNIEPGIAPIYEIKTTKNKIFFRVGDITTNTYQLYVSDGTVNGTFMLKDLVRDGLGGTYYITPVNNEVYFFMYDYNYNAQLWVTDGTVANTLMVKDFTNIGQSPFLATSANGLFYFTLFTNENGRELWRSNGTDEGTFMVKDISTSTDFDNGPAQLTEFKNKLYFSADYGTGRQLWYTDGTESGTTLAPGNNGVKLSDDYIFSFLNVPFTVIGNNFYTKATTTSTGTELFKYDVTGGFKLIKDITPGTKGGDISDIFPFNNGIAFVYTDSVNETNKLYVSKGYVGNATLIHSSGNYSLTFDNLAAADSILYFTFHTNDSGTELWKTNGAPNNITLVKDIYSGAVSSNPRNLTFFNNKFFFNAASKNAGTELWQTDGTEEGTGMVSEINTNSTAGSAVNYTVYEFSNDYKEYGPGAILNNELFFSATKPETGNELYKSDGTNAGTKLANDLVKGETGSSPYNFINRNGNIYFITLEDTSRLYKIDSIGKPTILVSTKGFIECFDVAKNGLVFYAKINDSSKTELWRSDGSEAGTFILATFNMFQDNIITCGNTAYFSAEDEGLNVELWNSDGTVAGTKMVKDIYSGVNGSWPYSLHSFKGDVYFGAQDSLGTALWKSNGTNAGTIKLASIQPYNSIGPFDFFCAFKNRLYFSAFTQNFGYELWKTDGTPEGTKMLKDTNGYDMPNPSFLTNVNGTLFFATSNHDLYKSDGTSAGTVLVKNISVPDYYLFDDRCVADGKLFFNAGHALWVSDGTDLGTHKVHDGSLQNVSGVNNMVAAGNSVFFDGYTYKYGSELYVGDATQVDTNNIAKAETVKINPATFSASVLQNPVQSALRLNIKSFSSQTLHIIISGERGNVIAHQNISVPKGTANINLSASNWQPGIYVIQLTGNAGDAVSITVLK